MQDADDPALKLRDPDDVDDVAVTQEESGDILDIDALLAEDGNAMPDYEPAPGGRGGKASWPPL